MRNYILILLIFITILFSGCSSLNEVTADEKTESIIHELESVETPIEYEKINVSYTYSPHPSMSIGGDFSKLSTEEKFYASVIECSTGAVVGEFISITKENELLVFRFKNTKVLYGNVPEDTIEYVERVSAFETTGEGFGENCFVEGEKYLLFLWKRDSVSLPYSRYGIEQHTYIPLSDEKLADSAWGRGKIIFEENVTAENVINYYQGLALEKGYDDDRYSSTVFRNESLESVTKNSDIVLEVTVVSKMMDGIYAPSTNYNVEINRILNGAEYIGDSNDGTYIINTHKDALEKGKTYIVTLSRIGLERNYKIFDLSAQNGIIPIEDTETVSQVYEWLGLEEPVTE